jgi:hypothetical protein
MHIRSICVHTRAARQSVSGWSILLDDSLSNRLSFQGNFGRMPELFTVKFSSLQIIHIQAETSQQNLQ